jgi:hypothetical protein
MVIHKCQKCGLDIRLRRGCRPLNPNGSDHADTYRREINRLWMTYGHPKRFVSQCVAYPEQEIVTEGFIYRGEFLPFHIMGPTIVGENYKPTDGEGLPW